MAASPSTLAGASAAGTSVLGRSATSSAAAIVAVYAVVFLELLPAFLIVTGLRLDLLLPVDLPFRGLQVIVGGVLAVGGGGGLVTSSFRLWFEGRGLPISHLPPTAFVATGLYKYVRHPIYVGFTALAAGVALLLGSFWMLAASVPLLTMGWICYVAFYEEPALVERFGETYLRYRRQVGLFGPRWGRSAWTHRLVATTFHALNALAARTVFARRGRLILVSYGAFITAGALLTMGYMSALLLAQGWTLGTIGVLVATLSVAAVAFGKAVWWAGRWRDMLREPLYGLRAVGFVSWGALLGLLLASALVATKTGHSLLVITDVLMASLPLCYMLGRIGCLTYGCCYGSERCGHGIVYRSHEAKAVRESGRVDVARYPTQVLSAAHGLVVFLVLLAVTAASPPVGLVTALGFIVYGAGRFVEEFLRDRDRPFFGLLTVGQAGAGAVLAAGCVLLFVVDPRGAVFAPADLATAVSTILANALSIGPALFGAAGFLFVATSFHWKRIGSW
jgi:prolipoprotein diacylglyceryltransferase/protein-S-isoprenylcysteine O-methyltransferase Ste14